MQSGPLTFCSNGMTFPCLVLVWVWHFPRVPSFSATGRAIILVPSLSQRSRFLKMLPIIWNLPLLVKEQENWLTLQTTWESLSTYPTPPAPAKQGLPEGLLFCLHSVLPTAVEVTRDSCQWLQLLCPRQGHQASPLNILDSQERENEQEVTSGLESESGVLHQPQWAFQGAECRWPENEPAGLFLLWS